MLGLAPPDRLSSLMKITSFTLQFLCQSKSVKSIDCELLTVLQHFMYCRRQMQDSPLPLLDFWGVRNIAMFSSAAAKKGLLQSLMERGSYLAPHCASFVGKQGFAAVPRSFLCASARAVALHVHVARVQCHSKRSARLLGCCCCLPDQL